MTFRPTFSYDGPASTVSLTADVATRFRISLNFSVHFRSEDSTRWELQYIKSKQSQCLASVQAVRDRVAEHVALMLQQNLDQLQPLIAAARELGAARALQDVYRAREDLARAAAHENRAMDVLATLGVSEDRAAEVSTQLRARTGARLGYL
ncbi:hypothetical protein ABR737_01460 [Streptomyces sp. Edi2]|uniref:hypothetical protein n=1 Tax=Streptomyces sp. Edi2 TaxID=3162528 RepID=UPI00330630AC